MMSDQYQQTFTTTDAHNNITYIQFVHPSHSNVVYCKEETNEGEYYSEDNFQSEDHVEEALEESYIEEDPIEETIEILESVIVDRKKTHTKTSSDSHHLTKKLVQVISKCEMGVKIVLKCSVNSSKQEKIFFK